MNQNLKHAKDQMHPILELMIFLHFFFSLDYQNRLKFCKKYTLQGIPAFRDFTIRDPRYFMILFQSFVYV